MSNFAISGLIQPALPAADEVLYVRNTGLDTNVGSLASPLLTIEGAIALLKKRPGSGLRQVINLTDFTNVIAATILFEALSAGPKADQWVGRAGAYDDGKQDDFDYPLEFQADPTLVTSITITGSANNVVGMKTFTVSETLVVDAHVDQWVFDPDQARHTARIVSNTTNTITTVGTTTFNGACGIYTEGGQFNFDDPGKGINISAACPVVFNGLRFTGWVNAETHHNVFFNVCSFDAGLGVGNGSDRAQIRSCVVKNWFNQVRGNIELKTSIFRSVFPRVGNGLSTQLFSSLFDGCTSPLGTLGNTSFLTIDGCIVRNGTSHGILKDGDGTFQVLNTLVEDNAGDGIHASVGGGPLDLDSVTGVGNGGVGIRLLNGCHAVISGTEPTVTGTAGDVVVGAQVYTWAEVTAARALGEGLDDLHIGSQHSPHWSEESSQTDGYLGGFIDFFVGNNDFTTPQTFGTVDVGVGAHMGFVQGVVSIDSITLRVTGNSVTDLGGEIIGDTEDIVIAAGAANRYFETLKKWNGQVTTTHVTGTAVVWNYGWVKYWDHRNQNFRLEGFEVLWQSDSTDDASDVEVLHHSADNWVYGAGGPTHLHLARRSVDYTDDKHRIGPGAWKRTNLSQDIAGGDAEGIIIHFISDSVAQGNKSFRTINVTLDIRTGLTGQSRQMCRIS